MTTAEKLTLAQEALNQSALELDEAANIMRGRGLPTTAELFMIAAQKKRDVAYKLQEKMVPA